MSLEHLLRFDSDQGVQTQLREWGFAYLRESDRDQRPVQAGKVEETMPPMLRAPVPAFLPGTSVIDDQKPSRRLEDPARFEQTRFPLGFRDHVQHGGDGDYVETSIAKGERRSVRSFELDIQSGATRFAPSMCDHIRGEIDACDPSSRLDPPMNLKRLRARAAANIENIMACADFRQIEDFVPVGVLVAAGQKEQQYVVEARPGDAAVFRIGLGVCMHHVHRPVMVWVCMCWP